MYKYIHSTICNRILPGQAKKLVYMFCNEKILSHIEEGGYKESMPSWTYDYCPYDEANFNIGITQCTNVEIEQNLTLEIEYWDEQIHKQWKDVEQHTGDHQDDVTQDDSIFTDIEL